jgi:YD repeat-containing protein
MGGPPAVGNLLNYTDSTVMGTWSFQYDHLNRLSLGTQTPLVAAPQSYCWAYDAFGNRTGELELNSTGTAATQAASPCPALTSSNATHWANHNAFNQTTTTDQAVTYDGAGNVTQDTRNAYVYDPEGRICAVENTTGSPTYTEYLYDAEGRRVAKGSQTNLSCGAPTAANGFTLKSQYLLDAGGDQVTELGPGANPATNWVHSNIWQGGRLTGTYTSNGLHFDIADPLGTKRVQALISALGLGVPELNCLSLPFGNNVGNTLLSNCVAVGSGGTDATEHHFTGKERDTESGNDYFGGGWPRSR